MVVRRIRWLRRCVMNVCRFSSQGRRVRRGTGWMLGGGQPAEVHESGSGERVCVCRDGLGRRRKPRQIRGSGGLPAGTKHATLSVAGLERVKAEQPNRATPWFWTRRPSRKL